MDKQAFNAQDYVNGNSALPADFDTAYRHHLETAKEIVRLRREGHTVTMPARARLSA